MPADPSATLLVNGAWQSGAATFDVTDPATLKVIAQAADAGAQEALAALDAADAAAEGWRRTTAEERS
ncbi:MAG: aldehyde dehydrogenase family protein, partial [Spirillospora sp.]